MLDIIDRLEKTIGKQIQREDLIAEAEDEGMTQRDAEELIERLIRDGTLHYPRIGMIQRTR
jgi:DNA replicative helicase MCM subunit Mcm2 (Cdc46/Mcm family)